MSLGLGSPANRTGLRFDSEPASVFSPNTIPRSALKDEAIGGFDPMNYGATGDNVADDTEAIQEAFTRARAAQGSGKVILTPPPNAYRLNETVEIDPPDGRTETGVSIDAGLGWADLAWWGADDSAVFHSRGWKRGSVRGCHVVLPHAASGVVAWEFDDAPPDSSASYFPWENCQVTMQTGSSDCVGWRMGAGGGLDISFLTWVNSHVVSDAVDGHKGWVSEHANVLAMTWLGCYSARLDEGWSGASMEGNNNGGGGMSWVGCGSSLNVLDFKFRRAGSYLISGGRFELGDRILDSEIGDTASATIKFDGVDIADYDTSASVFLAKGSIALALDAVLAYHGTATYHSQFIQNYGTGGYNSLAVENCRLCVDAAGWYDFPTGTSALNLRNNVRLAPGSLAGAAQLAAPQTYAASNVTTDRTYDANSTTTDELADVLGTLIADLRTQGIVK